MESMIAQKNGGSQKMRLPALLGEAGRRGRVSLATGAGGHIESEEKKAATITILLFKLNQRTLVIKKNKWFFFLICILNTRRCIFNIWLHVFQYFLISFSGTAVLGLYV